MKILSEKAFREHLTHAYMTGRETASVPFMGGCPKCGRTNGTDEQITKRKIDEYCKAEHHMLGTGEYFLLERLKDWLDKECK